LQILDIFSRIQIEQDARKVFCIEHNERTGEIEQRKQFPQVNMRRIDAYSPPETLKLVTQAGLARAAMPWADLIVKSFLGGAFISLGALFNLIVAGMSLASSLRYR
jgi:hypothetical protein